MIRGPFESPYYPVVQSNYVPLSQLIYQLEVGTLVPLGFLCLDLNYLPDTLLVHPDTLVILSLTFCQHQRSKS